MTAKPIRTYEIAVEGFPGYLYCARSPAKARAQAYRAYQAAYDASFRDFLRVSTLRRVPNPPGVGERVLIAGLPATKIVNGGGQYVGFMRDDSDEIFYSHPADVKPLQEDAA